MTEPADPTDAEIAAIVERLAAAGSGYTAIRRHLAARYGAPRVWSRLRIRTHVWKHRHHQRGQRSPFERDRELRAIFEDLILIRPMRAIRAACWAKLGPRRTPSLRSFHRHARRYRLMLRMLDGRNWL